MLLYCAQDGNASTADPATTEVVNAAVNLFALALPLQSPKVQESSVEQIATVLSSQNLQRNPGRKAAITVNVGVALLHALKVAIRESDGPGGELNAASEKIFQELLQVGIALLPPLVHSLLQSTEILSGSRPYRSYYRFRRDRSSL